MIFIVLTSFVEAEDIKNTFQVSLIEEWQSSLNEHFPMAQKEEEEKVVDLTVARAEEDLSAGVAQLAAARVTAEMREAAAIRKFIHDMDPFWEVASSPNPARVGEWLDHVALNPLEYCRRMSARHNYVLTRLAEHCLHRKL